MKMKPKLSAIASVLFAAALPLGAQTAQQPAAAPAAPQPNAAAPAAPTVTIVMKDGKTIPTTAVRRSGDSIMATVPVGTGMGEVGYPLSGIARVNFPEPPQIKAATALLEQGKYAEALGQVEPIVQYYSNYKDIPGNFWAAAAKLKLKALVSLQRDKDAQAVLDEIVKSSNDPESARLAKVLQAASWGRAGQHEKAMAVFDDVISTSNDDETLARAWLGKGNSLYALQDFDGAILAYLHVPVFYSDQTLLMPAAMLGGARAMVHIEDLPDAQKTFNDLLEQYPSSPEAATAKSELKKIDPNAVPSK
jgi:tetratricopeptide (TPR) repeat protein